MILQKGWLRIMADLVLYYMPGCQYCQKVLRFMEQKGIKLPMMKNTGADPKLREELIKIGGKGQVPCLVINGRPMYESDDIIEWLSENWK